jgi:hypothetical protein
MSIIDKLFTFPIRLIDKIRVFIEYLANWVELGVWRVRDPLIFTLLAILIIPLLKSGLTALNAIKFKEIDTANGVNEILNNSQSNSINSLYTIICALILGVILFEIGLQYINYRTRQKKKKGIVTIIERGFTLISYAWATLEMTSMYSSMYPTYDPPVEFFKRVFPNMSGQQIGALIKPIIITVSSITSSQGGLVGLGIFLLFFYGVGRNKTKFKFFIRYHYIQAILLYAMFGFQFHIYALFTERSAATSLMEFIGITLYSVNLSILILGISATILGRETNFPFIHDAIQYHTGRKEDEGKGFLDL